MLFNSQNFVVSFPFFTAFTLSVVSHVELANMSVVHSGDRGVYLSGYNSTIRDLTVEGNGCGGIGMEGGDQVSNTLNSQD